MSGDRYYIKDQNALYFITRTIVNWLDVFIRQQYKYVIVDSLKCVVDKKGRSIYVWFLMTSHMQSVASILPIINAIQ